MKVKIFSKTFYVKELEKRINEFLNSVNIQVNDIKVSQSDTVYIFYTDTSLSIEPVETTNEQPKDGIWYSGKHLDMSYEELVDLLAHYRERGSGETLKRSKCSKAFGTVIPMTDY